MVETGLDAEANRRIAYAASHYGAVIAGGDAEKRVVAVREVITEPFVVIDARLVTSLREFLIEGITSASGASQDGIGDDEHIGMIDFERALAREHGQPTSLFVKEFDSMPKGVQTEVAQLLKGVVESDRWAGSLFFSCDDSESVIKAEPDLSGRIRSWKVWSG